MPLGHADLLHSGKLWMGIVFCVIPLSFLLYGERHLDARAIRLNPRERPRLCSVRVGAPEPARGFEVADRR